MSKAIEVSVEISRVSKRYEYNLYLYLFLRYFLSSCNLYYIIIWLITKKEIYFALALNKEMNTSSFTFKSVEKQKYFVKNLEKLTIFDLKTFIKTEKTLKNN